MKKSCLESLHIYSDLSSTLKVLYYAHFPVYAIIFGCLLEHLCQKHDFFSYFPLLQDLYSPSVQMLCFSACVFKAPHLKRLL